MRYGEIKTQEDMIAYLVDCTLATVSDMASKKSRAKGEYKRQISIAQKAIDKRNFHGIDVDFTTTRAEDVINDFNCSVEEWAKQYEV